MRLLRTGILGFLVLLGGCATNSAHSPKDEKGSSLPITRAEFKLSTASVKWLDNPGFSIRNEQTIPLALTIVATHAVGTSAMINAADQLARQPNREEIAKNMANSYIGEILDLFRHHSVEKTSAMLRSAGVAHGPSHEILISPVSGYQSSDGWGTNVIFRTNVKELSTGRNWQTDLQVNSGIHWVGVHNAGKPTTEFVDQYVNGLLDALRKSGAI